MLYCSGYTRDALLEDGYLMENVDLIQKPYRKEALAQSCAGHSSASKIITQCAAGPCP